MLVTPTSSPHITRMFGFLPSWGAGAASGAFSGAADLASAAGLEQAAAQAPRRAAPAISSAACTRGMFRISNLLNLQIQREGESVATVRQPFPSPARTSRSAPKL